MGKNVFIRALELFCTFFKIGLFTFGGGLAMLTLISREVVENKRWITDKDMGDIVVIAESTPGAIAVNTATYVGYKTAGVLGSVFATLGCILPSLIVISVIYVFFDMFKENRWVAAGFKGVRAAVIVLLFNAFTKLFKPMKKNAFTVAASIIVFAVTLFTEFNSIYLILAGGFIGVTYFMVSWARVKRKNPSPVTGGDTGNTGENAAKQPENDRKTDGEGEL
ncbi:MAG: chromate transporter [Clostridia bacterium]|nr:chromate transporter [Clostridia bacterium]